MILTDINILMVVLAALASVALGFVWYSPFLFGKAWMKYSGINPSSKTEREKMRKEATPAYIGSTLGALLTAYVTAYFVKYFKIDSSFMAASLAFWLWLGFIAPSHLPDYLYNKKPLGLYALSVGYYLMSLILMALILTFWG